MNFEEFWEEKKDIRKYFTYTRDNTLKINNELFALVKNICESAYLQGKKQGGQEIHEMYQPKKEKQL